MSRALTLQCLTTLLGVTLTAVHQWRKGSTTRAALPVVVSKVGRANRVVVQEADLRKWLANYRPDLLGKLPRMDEADG